MVVYRPERLGGAGPQVRASAGLAPLELAPGRAGPAVGKQEDKQALVTLLEHLLKAAEAGELDAALTAVAGRKKGKALTRATKLLNNAFKLLAAGASADEKAALFRETARRFYQLP